MSPKLLAPSVSPRSCVRLPFLFTLLAGLLALLPAASPAAARPVASRPPATVALSNGTQAISQLMIGDDLYAAVGRAPALSPFELRLFAPDGILLASESGVTDAAGNTPPVLLWWRTGVVGCNPCLPPDPALWRFEYFSQAEATLAGQVLTVELANPVSQQVLASVPVTVVAPAQEIAYFSGSGGCPREEFASSEPIYLTLFHPDATLPQRRLFLPAATGLGWPLGQPIADARGSLQVIHVPAAVAGTTLATFPVAGTGALPAGLYDGLFRFHTIDTPLVLPHDAEVASRYVCGDGRIRGGIMITLDDCTNCPPS